LDNASLPRAPISVTIKMSATWKRILYFAGGSLGLIGIVFVALRLKSYSAELDFSQFTPSVWSLIIFLSVIYGAANLFLSVAWRKLLLYFAIQIPLLQAIRLFGLSQLAKYVPGNIFHLAGRQALGMAAGLPAKVLAKSAVWELGGFVVAGVLFAPIVAPLVLEPISVWLSLGGFAAALLCAWLVVRRMFAATVSNALLAQCCFLAISGVIFVAILALVSPQSCSAPLIPALCGAYIISWLAGFVTPGAPAGVGVRELVLLFLLKGLVLEADLLLAVVLGRVVTVLGDFLFFLAALLIRDVKGAAKERPFFRK